MGRARPGAAHLPAQFAEAYAFQGGLAFVTDQEQKLAYIDKNGKYVWREP